MLANLSTTPVWTQNFSTGITCEEFYYTNGGSAQPNMLFYELPMIPGKCNSEFSVLQTTIQANGGVYNLYQKPAFAAAHMATPVATTPVVAKVVKVVKTPTHTIIVAKKAAAPAPAEELLPVRGLPMGVVPAGAQVFSAVNKNGSMCESFYYNGVQDHTMGPRMLSFEIPMTPGPCDSTVFNTRQATIKKNGGIYNLWIQGPYML